MRLTSFDIKEYGGTRILKHEWAYDSMGRKSAAAGITVSGGSPALPSPITFAYDAASRVTNEALDSTWSVSYGYDTAGNRTSVNDGTINKTIGYGAGNREASVSGGIDPLGYDYKGNVVSRMTLDGTKTYHYGWDAFDRLTSATQMWSGGATVGYDYDAMGRLLRRTKTDASGTSTTINYWLGLNKLAEERIVDDGSTEVFRPDSEDSYPEANGWGYYDIGWDFAIQYAEDSVRGQVLTLAGIGGAASMIVGDDSGENYNGNATAWAATGRRQLGFWFKNDDQAEIQFTVFCRASSGYGTLVFVTAAGTDYIDSGNGCYVYYLGNSGRFPAINDGNWNYIELDLGALQTQFSGVAGAITHVDGLSFTLDDCQIQLDDITLSAGAMERSYGLGYTGAQTGANGARDVNSNTQCVSAFGRYYYHFSDLKTLLATSNTNGSKLGVYEAECFGKYKHVTGYKPDYMGITEKYDDAEAGLSYFGFRWYESERGRWLSKEPHGTDGPNLYLFNHNNPILYMDSNGLKGVDAYDHAGDMRSRETHVIAVYVRENTSCLDENAFFTQLNMVYNIGLCYKGAIELAEKYKSNPRQKNAIRHCFWQCCLARGFSVKLAEDLAAAHELDFPDIDPSDHAADLHNNKKGRDGINTPKNDCESRCLALWKGGLLR